MQQIPLIKNKINFDETNPVHKFNLRGDQSDHGSHNSRKGVIKFEVEKANKKQDKEDDYD